MRNLVDIGLKLRRRNPYPPATEVQIGQFEKHYNVSLPLDYVAFLKFCNGGSPSKTLYSDPRGGESEVNDFYGLGTQEADDTKRQMVDSEWDIGNLWGETRIWRPWIGTLGVPFARDGGNNQLFLDYATSPPSVGKLSASTRKAIRIADTFAAFLDMLH